MNFDHRLNIFLQSHKFDALKKSVTQLVHTFIAPPSQVLFNALNTSEVKTTKTVDGRRIRETIGFKILFYFSTTIHEPHILVICHFKFVGNCISLEKMEF